MPAAPGVGTMGGVSYAVTWRERGGRRFAGSLELRSDALVLCGSAGGSSERRSLRLGELVDVHVERSAGGLPVLVVSSNGTRLEIASLEGRGALHELAEDLAEAQGSPD